MGASRFWAPWCGPCMLMKPAIERFANERTGQILVLTINTTMYGKPAEEFSVAGLPSLVLLRKGKEIARNVGALSFEELEKFVGEHLT